jgi:hypothetical protein
MALTDYRRMTGKELRELERTDPDEYKEATAKKPEPAKSNGKRGKDPADLGLKGVYLPTGATHRSKFLKA